MRHGSGCAYSAAFLAPLFVHGAAPVAGAAPQYLDIGDATRVDVFISQAAIHHAGSLPNEWVRMLKRHLHG